VLKELLQKPVSGIQLNVANSIWTQKGSPVLDGFMKTMRQDYGAEVSALDFQDAKAPGIMNDWVKKNTNGKIDKVVDSPIDPQTVLFLINAVYFKGNWKDEFKASDTRNEDFFLTDGSKKKVPMMSRSADYEYLKGDGFQAVRLPYGEGQMAMTVMLPDGKLGLDSLFAKLQADPALLTKPFKQSAGELQLPKFKIEYEAPLNDALKKMGMGNAFDPNAADLSAMANVKGRLFVDKVKHKTFLEVIEKGTEAAAVTSVAVTGSAPTERFQMIVNRPFLLAIQDRQTGSLLFFGSVADPVGTS
jgi:serpin B